MVLQRADFKQTKDTHISLLTGQLSLSWGMSLAVIIQWNPLLTWPVLKQFYILHDSDVIMSMMASQTTGFSIVCSAVCSGTDQRQPKLSITGLCEGNPPVTGGFPSQRASNRENVFIWWRHHVAWQWQVQDKDQTMNSQKSLHSSPVRARYGVSFVSILEENELMG